MQPAQLLADLQHDLRSVFDAIDIAEEEITTAQRRHPKAADRIWRSFLLLRPPTDALTRNDLVYRAHCRELLDRVAAGADTRPGTAAECCVALCEVSLRVPLNTSAAGLYARMWKLADLPPIDLADASTHYEALEGALIDDQETMLRQKLSQDWRRLPPASPPGPDQ
ncbi:hypothetical protein ACTOB_003691 [Actinoplanes oblitus]|uniref:Uncharacterized protein n=1 Tax=Actinoplanes oblitus TaxID=3040509 RepID=A0ABY8WQ78_9ACTN|nr:hypothetical protein [Actinoplanes oblitus]WIN00016.1 hypothetical protein ACTOB_003691 [Actinoplanes oblitus]